MIEFKEGDKIRLRTTCSGAEQYHNKILKLKWFTPGLFATSLGGFPICNHETHWVLAKSKKESKEPEFGSWVISSKSIRKPHECLEFPKRFKRCKDQFICPHCEYFGCYSSKKCVLEKGHKSKHSAVIKW